jgi:transcription antitermination factor NusG
VTSHAPSVFNGKKVSELVLYFTRSEEHQKAIAPLLDARISLPDQISDAGEHHRHLFLGVRVDHEGVEAGLMCHSTAWLDVMNLLNRCRQSAEAGEFVRLVRSMPAGCSARVSSVLDVPAPEFEVEHVKRLEEAVLNETFLIRFGRRLPPGDPALAASSFMPYLREMLVAHLALWDFMAWRPASNYLVAGPPNGAALMKDSPVVSHDGGIVDFGVGARVRLVDGVFAGRPGVVVEIDAKGHVRVMVGKVAVRVDARQVRPER